MLEVLGFLGGVLDALADVDAALENLSLVACEFGIAVDVSATASTPVAAVHVRSDGVRSVDLLRGANPVVHGFFNAGCAGRSLCAITRDDGALFVSTSPTKPSSWHQKSSKGQHAGVFCPRRGRCVAPGGSCPTRSFCAVLDTIGDGSGDGRVSISTAPARGAKHWKSVTIDRGNALTAISCATAKLCFAVDSIGNVFYSTRPSAASSWHVADRAATPLNAISCPSSGFCIAVGANGLAVTGSNP